MFIIKIFILHMSIFNMVDETRGLVEPLLGRESSCIKITEVAIRATFNKLFSTLKVKFKDNLKIKRFSEIHNNFVSLTLRDHYTIKKIVKITTVDKTKIDNGTANFIDLINEILNADSNDQNENSKLVASITQHLVKNVDNCLQKLIHYQNLSTSNNSLNENDLEDSDKKNTYNDTTATPTVNRTATTEHNENEDLPVWHDDGLDEEDVPLNNSNKFWESGRRIYDGKKTKVKIFPFVASIQIFEEFQCGGAIIENDLILSAASCLQLAYNNRFYRENPAFLAVRVGSDFYKGGGELIPVLEVYFHPSYNPKTLRNNLVILRLRMKMHMIHKTPRVKKIEIAKRTGQLPFTIEGITIVGWGASKASNIIEDPYHHRISYAVINICSYEECRDVYTDTYVSRELNFCAGKLTEGSGACHRDVGGPGVIGGYLAGIVSFGSPVCGTPNAPTVFTRLSPYVDWIESIMAQEIDTDLIPVKREMTTKLVTKRKVLRSYKVTTESNKPAMYNEEGKFKPKVKVPRSDPRTGFVEKFLSTMFNSEEVQDFMYFFIGEDGNDPNAVKESKTRSEYSGEFAENEKSLDISRELDNMSPLKQKTQDPPLEYSDLESLISDLETSTFRHKIKAKAEPDDDYRIQEPPPFVAKRTHHKTTTDALKIDVDEAELKLAESIFRHLTTRDPFESYKQGKSSQGHDDYTYSDFCSDSIETYSSQEIIQKRAQTNPPHVPLLEYSDPPNIPLLEYSDPPNAPLLEYSHPPNHLLEYSLDEDNYPGMLPLVSSKLNDNSGSKEDNVVVPKSLLIKFLSEMLKNNKNQKKTH